MLHKYVAQKKYSNLINLDQNTLNGSIYIYGHYLDKYIDQTKTLLL